LINFCANSVFNKFKIIKKGLKTFLKVLKNIFRQKKLILKNIIMNKIIINSIFIFVFGYKN
jgi:hypothetical protein